MTHSNGAFLARAVALIALASTLGCQPSVRLKASWHDPAVQTVGFSKVLVVAFGKDLEKRLLTENALVAELHAHGFNAAGSIGEFGPSFTQDLDSVRMRNTMIDHGFDGSLTFRVASVNEQDRWVPGAVYYGPARYYRGFYGYYYRVWSYYQDPGYLVTDVRVLLESNCYRVATGTLLWTGQSVSFTRDPTPAMAARFAKDVIGALLTQRIIRPRL